MSTEERSLPIGVKSFDSLFDSLRWAPFSLALHLVLDNLKQNGAILTQKLTPGFKNHIRNLSNFRQAVESLNSMGYICPKNTFLQLKHIQRIYLTLLSTNCVKIHQIPYVIFETVIHFSRQNSSVLF